MSAKANNISKVATTFFPVAVDSAKLETPPQHHTDEMSLGQRPPRLESLGLEVSRFFLTRVRFYLWELPSVTVLHVLFYGLLFGAPLFLAYRFRNFAHSIWQQYFSNIALPWAQSDVALLLSNPVAVALWLMALFVLFYVLNAFDLFWDVHRGRTQVGALVVRDYLMFRPLTSMSESIDGTIYGDSLHFGSLKVLYGFNKDVFFVRSEGEHATMVVDLSIVSDVSLGNAHQGWWGIFGNPRTPPIRLQLNHGRNRAVLMIHGSYFEQNGDGTERANIFVRDLKSAIAEKKKAFAVKPTSQQQVPG